ncbi:MAG TPA: serine/threonine-protein kinase [Kofleriaceae bacterium]|nr:serine/threonine-protein kinase [Kofleriaceae bacterium]
MRPASEPPARRQGRYVLGELLGRGGMAEVFAGHVLGSHGFQKPVAIKRLLPELANDHVFVERLISEAKLLVGMTHGNIVSVLDLARDGDDVFLVMEFVDGPSLRQLLKARGARGLSLGNATYIVQAAAAGLEFAHARPGGAIIHADISPSNLLLTTSGEVRVADFGIARREGGGAGIVEGKWAYMAPEQARGEALTPRSDVFALGVVLYELITGQHPFGQRVTPDERDSGPIRIAPPRVVNPAVPAGLDAICMQALADKTRDRYARMQHFIDAIIDERFANQWREGANDLAQAIREVSPGAVHTSAGPRTQVTDNPVTIITRSLISQPARLPSAPIDGSVETQDTPSLSTGARTSMVEMPSVSGAQTSLIEVPSESAARTSAVLIPPSGALTSMVEIPPPRTMPRSSSQMPFQLPAALLPSPELASVHGGSIVTGASVVDARSAHMSKWTFAVLGIAALIGVIAGIAITLGPDREPAATRESPPAELVTHVVMPPEAPAPAAAPPTPEPTVPEPTVPEPTVPAEAVAAEPPPAAVAESVAAPATKEASTAPRRARTAPPSKKVASGAADATLRVNTYEGTWAWAYVNGQKQYAPGAKFKVAAGRYTVKLSNPDLGVVTCPVSIGSGEVMTLKVELEERACDVSKY